MSSANEPLIECVNLGKRVPIPTGELTILSDINFDVHRGETLAIVGESGSGKSTLLGLMAGLDQSSDGFVRFAGKDLNKLDEDGRAAVRAGQVGFVFQSFQLLQSLTALENVMLPLELAGIRSAHDAAVEILGRVGLQKRLRHYPVQLSGGEQQRVAIARAFAVQPAVLFADEPTGNLDRATGETISELIFGLNREHETTLVLVTHDAALAAPCNAKVVLDAGRLAEVQR